MENIEKNMVKLTPKTQKTYNKIIKHAKKEFSNRGYSNTSIHSIAKKAGLSVGCLYKYFSSKDELYQFIISSEQRKIKQYLNDAIRNVEKREEKEKEGLRAWLYYVRDNPGVYRLIWETLFIDQKAFDEYYYKFAKSYQRRLEQSDEPINTPDLFNLSYALVGISNFLGIRIIGNKNKTTDEEIEKMVDCGHKLISKGIFIK